MCSLLPRESFFVGFINVIVDHLIKVIPSCCNGDHLWVMRSKTNENYPRVLPQFSLFDEVSRLLITTGGEKKEPPFVLNPVKMCCCVKI